MTLLVDAINRTTCQAVLRDGQVLPITHWVGHGEECDLEDATYCICGPCKKGYWYVVNLSEMDGEVQ